MRACRGQAGGRAWIAALLVLLAAAVYWPVAGFDFVDYDDQVYVFQNARVLRGLTADGLAWAFSSLETGNWHPLAWLSHMLDVELFGLWAGGHHLTSLALHALNSVLLFLLLAGATGATGPSALAAALFAVHPLRVESVAWVSERKDVLSAAFFLLTLGAYAANARRPSGRRLAAALGFYVLGLASKPMLVMVPAVLLLLDWWPLGRLSRGDGFPRLRLLLAEKIPFLLLAGGAAAAALVAQRQIGAVMPVDKFSEAFRYSVLKMQAANALKSYVLYLVKTVWPARLAVLYPFPVHDPTLWWKGALSLAVVCAVTALVIFAARRAPYLAAGWLWYLLALLPVIGFIQVGVQGFADRYTYLPSIGVFVMAAWGGQALLRRTGVPAAAGAWAAAALVLALALAGAGQVRHWRNGFTLFGHALEVTDGNYVIHKNLGASLARLGRYEEAIAQYRKSLAIRPKYVEALNALGAALAAQGKPDEAIPLYRQALDINPSHADTVNNLGRALLAKGQNDEAAGLFRRALSIKPDHPEALNNLGLVLAAQERYDEAAAILRQALERNPDSPEMRFNLGLVLALQGKGEEAATQLRMALKDRPAFPEAQQLLEAITREERAPGRGADR